MTTAQGLGLTLLAFNLVLGVLSLAVARGGHPSRALQLWGYGLLLYATGLLIIQLGFLPFSVRRIIGNAFIIVSPVLTIQGVLSYTRFRVNWIWTTAILAASLAAVIINHLGHSFSAVVDAVAPSPVANLLFAIAAIQLLRDPPPHAVTAARGLAALFILAVATKVMRTIVIISPLGGRSAGDAAITVALFAAVNIVVAVAATLSLLWIEMRSLEAELQRRGDTDGLTGLLNGQAIGARFALEAARAARHQQGFAVALFDVDGLGRINDLHGSATGDDVLKLVGGILKAGGRQVDLTARLDGDSFAVLLGEAGVGGAVTAADRLREQVAAAGVTQGGASLSVTLSAGVAIYPDEGSDWEGLHRVAAARLAGAKAARRSHPSGPAQRAGPAVAPG